MAGVAQIVNTLGHGGVENLSSRIASALAEARLGSHLVVTAKGPVELAYAMAPSVEVWSAERHFALDLGALRRMGRYFDSAGVDVVHSHNWVAAYHAQVAGFFARQRPVHVFHCHAGTRQGAHGPLDQWVLRGVDTVVCVTEAIRGSFEAQFGLPEDRCLLLPNGVEVYALAAPFEGSPTVVQVANLQDPKAHDVALQAAARLKQRVGAFRWVCIGVKDEDPGYTERIHRLVDELDLGDCVELVGPRSDVRDWLRKAHVGVLSSDHEGFPVSVLEYMAEALPVVMTDVGQAPHAIREAGAGAIVKVRDADALADAIALRLEDRPAARAEGLAGRAHVERFFGFAGMMKALRGLYADGLLRRGRSAAAARIRGSQAE